MTPVAERQRTRDGGFSIVEVVIAMAVLSTMVVAVLGLLLSALDGTRHNAQRIQAAGIAARQIEAMRGLSAAAIPDGVTTPSTSPVSLDGTAYSIQQSTAFLAGDGTTSVCSSTAERPTYKRVTVTVTWPDMGSTAPVRSDTLVAVGLGAAGLDATKGTAAILVRDAQSAPRAGMVVTLLPGGAQRTTDTDGCAVFSGLVPGSYTATVDKPGHVGLSGTQLASTMVGAVAGVVRRSTLDYDLAGSLAIQLVAPAGHALPAGVAIPVTLEAAHWSPTSRAFPDCGASGALPGSCVTSTPRTASLLFPASYTGWAGTCLGARPTTTPRVPVTPGSTSTVQAQLGGVSVRVLQRTGNTRVAGRTIFAHNVSDSGCVTSTWTLGASSAGGDTKIALPAGAWAFSLTNTGSAAPSASLPRRVLSAGTADPNVVELRLP